MSLGFLFLQKFNGSSLQLTVVLLHTSSVALNGIKSAMCEGFLILDLTTFENVCWKREYAVATEALKKLERTSELEGFWQSNRGCRDINLKHLLMVFFSLIHSIIINTTRLMCKIST